MARKNQLQAWTLVRHSAWEVTKNPQFQHAVEEAPLVGEKAVEKVRKAGGLIFDDYTQASEAEYATNYPPGVTGLIPRVRGTFARVRVDGQALYLPPKEERS